MRPLVTYPRVVNVVVDFLTGEGFNAAARLPPTWKPTDSPVIIVASDGTPQNRVAHPVAITPTVRLTAWSDSPTESHDLAMLAAGHMDAHDGSQFTARLDGGGIEAVDPDHGNAQLFAVTLRVRVRSEAPS